MRRLQSLALVIRAGGRTGCARRAWDAAARRLGRAWDGVARDTLPLSQSRSQSSLSLSCPYLVAVVVVVVAVVA